MRFQYLHLSHAAGIQHRSLCLILYTRYTGKYTGSWRTLFSRCSAEDEGIVNEMDWYGLGPLTKDANVRQGHKRRNAYSQLYLRSHLKQLFPGYLLQLFPPPLCHPQLQPIARFTVPNTSDVPRSFKLILSLY